MQFVPESPFYYITAGKTDKAKKVLEGLARDNGTKLPPGQLVSKGEKRWIELMRKDIQRSEEKANQPLSEENMSDSNGELPSGDTAKLMPTEIEFKTV